MTAVLLCQVDTEVFDVLVKETGRTKSELHDWAKSENELNEICTAEEIAGPILFLASDASSFISGVHIPIAGAAQVPAHARMHDTCMHAFLIVIAGIPGSCRQACCKLPMQFWILAHTHVCAHN